MFNEAQLVMDFYRPQTKQRTVRILLECILVTVRYVSTGVCLSTGVTGPGGVPGPGGLLRGDWYPSMH